MVQSSQTPTTTRTAKSPTEAIATASHAEERGSLVLSSIDASRVTPRCLRPNAWFAARSAACSPSSSGEAVVTRFALLARPRHVCLPSGRARHLRSVAERPPDPVFALSVPAEAGFAARVPPLAVLALRCGSLSGRQVIVVAEIFPRERLELLAR